MRVAIIGVGNVGSALARGCVAAGHSVVVTSKDPGHAAQVAAEVGAEPAPSNVEVVAGADLLVLAVPSTAVAGIADEIAEHVAGLTVVDTTNPMSPDPSEILSATGSAAEGVQLLLPEAAVVKAFNTILANRLTDPVVDGIPLDGLYAGTDAAAKARVAELVGDLGFRPLDAGDLPMARVLELMAFLNISLNVRNGWPWQSGWKLLGPTG
jgi:8-hydroxy-5-deazaflavin:NADPH oxidoreductase